jgi:hypothetical protein
VQKILIGLLAVLTVAVAVAPASRAGARDRTQGADLVSSGAGGYAYPFQNPALSPDARVRDLVARLTLDEKVGLLHQFSAAIIRLGIPQFRTGTEGLHGLSWLGRATVFPQNTGLSMTWNPALMSEVGGVIGQEARAYNSVDARFNGVDIWAPVVDLARDPRSGRASRPMGRKLPARRTPPTPRRETSTSTTSAPSSEASNRAPPTG